MAIEKIIPKDIKKYEPKLLGPFTSRQVFSFAPAVVISVGLFFGLKNILTMDARLFLITIVAVPFILLGWYKPYGLPFEKFIKTVFISTVLSPPQRKYRTARMDEDPPNSKARPKKKKKKTTDPMLQPYL